MRSLIGATVVALACGCGTGGAPTSEDLCGKIQELCGKEQRCPSTAEWQALGSKRDNYRRCLLTSRNCADVGDCNATYLPRSKGSSALARPRPVLAGR